MAREPDLLVAIFSDRAPGKFFRFNSSLKRCISLLRRGARGFSLHFATQTQQKPRRGGRPRGFQSILLTQNE